MYDFKKYVAHHEIMKFCQHICEQADIFQKMCN